MKNLTYLFCLIAFTFLLACGEDSVTNNPVPPPDPVTVDTVTLLTKDSIYFNQTDPVNFSTVSYLSTVQVDTIYLNFSYHTFSIRSRFSFKVDGDTLITYQRNIPVNTSFDTTFSLSFVLNKINFINFISIYPAGGFFSGLEHASLRNIKLWYIRRS